MVHDASKSYGGEIATLTIREKRSNSVLAPTYGEVTKLGGRAPKGIRIKIRHASNDTRIGTLSIAGEDLYALREFLSELPEETFVRPADPVAKPPRWTSGDILEEFYGPDQKLRRIWAMGYDGFWRSTEAVTVISPQNMEHYLDTYTSKDSFYFEIVRQASGQDL